MTTQWTIAIDWDRNGNFTGTYDDVTEYVLSANWFVGMRQSYQDSADNSNLTPYMVCNGWKVSFFLAYPDVRAVSKRNTYQQ